MVFVNVIGIGILFIFLLFILPKKRKVTSDYLLILSILIFGLYLLSNIWIKQEGLTTSKFILHYLSNAFLFPSLLTYGLVLIDEEHKIKKKWWWIYSAAIVFSLVIVIDVVFLNDYGTGEKLKVLHESPPLIHIIIYKALYIFIIFLLVWFLKKIKLYQNKIKEEYSFVELIHLNWFRNFTYVYLILHIVEFTLYLGYDLGIQIDFSILSTISSFLMVISVLYLCYNGIRQYTFAEFHESSKLEEITNQDSNGNVKSHSNSPNLKYKTSSLTEAEMNLLIGRVNELFDKEKVYLDPQLKIQNISERLQMGTHKISQTINTKGGTSYFDYVNGFRVAHLKNLLSKPENRKYTILALGIESGFNSKATLNRIFKKYERVSPKEFQKAQFTN